MTRCFAVIPAAGSGRRMGGTTPKQYLQLAGRRVIEHTLARFAHPAIDAICVAVTAGDPWWPEITLPDKPVRVAEGGAERCHSVLNALNLLAEQADPRDWVLVHDAARPCLRREDLEQLYAQLRDDPVGGLLGLTVADTVKRTDAAGRVIETVDRSGLWRALTPQMFRLGPLREALRRAIASGHLPTDEAQAMELAGHAPRLVEGHGDNIKITRPQDLPLAELYLRQQQECA